MSGVVTVQRALTPRNFTAAVDPTSGDDAADGVRVGDYWFNSASGNVFQCVTNTTGAAVWRHVPRIIAQSGVAASHTGDTNETTLATVTVPAGCMGVQGRLEVESVWGWTSSANNKTLRGRFSGGAGTAYQANVFTTSSTTRDFRVVQNRNSVSSQVAGAAAGLASGVGLGNAAVTSAVNTAVATTYVLTAQLASAGETITLESYKVTLLRPDIT